MWDGKVPLRFLLAVLLGIIVYLTRCGGKPNGRHPERSPKHKISMGQKNLFRQLYSNQEGSSDTGTGIITLHKNPKERAKMPNPVNVIRHKRNFHSGKNKHPKTKRRPQRGGKKKHMKKPGMGKGLQKKSHMKRPGIRKGSPKKSHIKKRPGIKKGSPKKKHIKKRPAGQKRKPGPKKPPGKQRPLIQRIPRVRAWRPRQTRNRRNRLLGQKLEIRAENQLGVQCIYRLDHANKEGGHDNRSLSGVCSEFTNFTYISVQPYTSTMVLLTLKDIFLKCCDHRMKKFHMQVGRLIFMEIGLEFDCSVVLLG